MQQYVIGTAGHVDHGKTVLIGALTGEQTDRLPEEQQRGISIDLGFAEFSLPSGKRAGVVDVPGHERFIKNMVAGVTGIDLVILVVAADEGVMPQTREHLDILQLLGVKTGVVALTKIDMVEDEWLELVVEELAEALEDTFLEGAPIVPVSAPQGVGLDRLISILDAKLDAVKRRDPSGFTRLAVDRSFTVPGFGTVVTGTLVSGTVHADDRLELLPSRIDVRVRGLQVHGESVSQAYAGQRVAINLSGVDVDEVSRGAVLLTPGSLRPTMSFAATVELLGHIDHILKNNERVRLHTGTSEILGRVLLLDRSQLLPGESTYMQFKAEQPIVVGRGDRYILRTYSPMRTIAGGEVLDPRRRFRRFNETHLQELAVRQEGDLDELVLLQADRSYPVPVSLPVLEDRLSVPQAELQPVVDSLVRDDDLVDLGGGLLLTPTGEEELRQQVQHRLTDYHARYPLRPGMPREEFRQAIMPGADSRDFQRVLDYIERVGAVKLKREFVALADFEPRLSDSQAQTASRLVAALDSQPFAPPDAAELLQDMGVSEKGVAELLGYLREQGKVVRIAEGLYFSASAVQTVVDRVRDWFANHDSITVSELRDLLGTSRKYAVPLLEYFDQERITQRVGDKRILRNRGQAPS